ncbi:MAG: hypothetical protein EOO56_17030, partial [Hymenobacter sp.]
MLRSLLLLPVAGLLLAACAKDPDPGTPDVPTSESAKNLVSAGVSDTIWNGVAVADNDRVFVLFPHNEGNPGTRIGELLSGKAVAYPNRPWNAWKK